MLDVAGAWVPAGEVRQGPVRILDCFPNYMGWTVSRAPGGAWRVVVRQVYHGGPALIALHVERLAGAWRGGTLRLEGEAGEELAPGVTSAVPLPAPVRVVYELRPEPRSGHLVGTRDGKPFRLARLILTRPKDGDCGPAPP